MLSVAGNLGDNRTSSHFPQMTFQASDLNTNASNLDDPVVISVQLGDLLVQKVLLDPGSSIDVLFYSTFRKMKLSDNILQHTTGDLVGFSGEHVPVMGSVWLQTTLGEHPLSKTSDVQFLVVDYDLIATIHSDHREARQCYNISLKQPSRDIDAHVNNISSTNKLQSLANLNPKAEFTERPTPTENLQKVYFYNNLDKFTYVVISHKLALDPSARPIGQKKRNLGIEKKHASLEETKKLINAGIIKEVRFTTWLANEVMVKKYNSKWRMYVDFTDLNKACPKDAYPLPSIDSLVDSTSGYRTLSFMDAYSGYNQILMHPPYQNKTAFITAYGNYYYKVMPFGLKNAGATY
ncbi:uncharacterized protein LOC107605090 [Arachis ipaensis]|uniref:uncharacterized protein LOC107605090 n=1 Tax=Arachis ipaensis TaxID=130454 RepID=UPI0007AF70C1|nr:uncharacterized protein LOC107605090 [Arachis ipaensis]XP_025628032.1 uncharacterized protein LOC112721170 [Arachis hypogaea]